MKKKLVIFGSGNHAKVIFSEIIKQNRYNFLGFIDDKKKENIPIIKVGKKTYYNLGNIKKIINSKNDFSGIIGIGLNSIRKKVYQEITKINKNFDFETIFSDSCNVNSLIFTGKGTLIMSGSVVNAFTKIGNHCIINTSCSLDHNNEIADFVSLGPGVITGGNVTIDENTHIGIGAKISNNIKIGSNVVVGANSFINKKCIDNYLYLGTPGKKKRKIKKNENYLK